MALSIVYWTNYVSGHSKLCRKSEASVESDRVLRFLFDNDNRVVTANVQASMKNTSYGVKIFLDEGDNGVIKTTECACPMREFKCHHVAAALLFGYKRASKTDVKCSWIKNPKSAPPKSTVTMATLYPPKQQEYRALKRTMNTEDRHFLYEQLGTLGRFTALHWILAEEPQVQQLSVPLIPDLLMDPQYLAAPDPDMWLIDNLPLTQEQVVETAFITVGQRENTHWAAVRKLRFTASNFGQILSAAKRNRLTASLKKRLLSAYNLEKRAPIQWGITNEKVAIEQYCQTGRVTVVQTGIWLHTSGVLGASPDGFVQGSYAGPVHQQEPGDYNAADILEVKCPFTAKDSSIMEVCRKNKDFYLEITDEGRFRLKPSHDYWHQIQGQLHLTGTTTCDFVVWCPHDMVVVRIKRDDTWAENLDVLIRFYFSNFLPSMK